MFLFLTVHAKVLGRGSQNTRKFCRPTVWKYGGKERKVTNPGDAALMPTMSAAKVYSTAFIARSMLSNGPRQRSPSLKRDVSRPRGCCPTRYSFYVGLSGSLSAS